MIRQLPAGHALIIRGHFSPVIARLGVAWKDRTYKTARRRGIVVAALIPVPAFRRLPPSLPVPTDRPAWPELPLLPAPGEITDPTKAGASRSKYPWN
jgi:hypothetical protein